MHFNEEFTQDTVDRCASHNPALRRIQRLCTGATGTTGTSPSPLDAATLTSAKAVPARVPPKAAVQSSADPCQPLLDVLAACADQPHCEQDLAMFLSGAARSSLVAVEDLPGFSEEAFDRYCLQSCQARAAKVDERAFARDVCAVGAPDGVKPEVPVGAMVSGFALTDKRHVGGEGVLLDAIEQALGPPGQETITPFKCDSGFEAGDIRLLSYPGLALESDGTTAVVRSIALAAGRRLLLSSDETMGPIDEAGFRHRFGHRAERVGDVYRVGGRASGDRETAYEFHFDNGSLTRVDYWIGC